MDLKPVKAALLRSNGERVEITLSSLESYQRAVGGFIEALALRGAVMYLNEDGKLDGLPVNDEANRLARDLGARISRDDLITGDVFIVGPTDEDGYDTDCPDSILRKIFGENFDGQDRR